MTHLMKQRGVTLFGFLMSLIVIVVLGIVILRVTPAYIEYFSVRQSLEAVKAQEKSINYDLGAEQQVRDAVQRRFDINDVRTINSKDVKIKRVGNGLEVMADYDVRIPLISNIYLLLDFKNAVTLHYAQE